MPCAEHAPPAEQLPWLNGRMMRRYRRVWHRVVIVHRKERTHDEENPLSKRCNFCERKICVFSDFDAHEVDCWKSQARDEQTPQVQPLESIVEETDMTMAMGKMSI